MLRSITSLITCSVVIACSTLSAQDDAQLPKPEKEHELLQLFVGQWDSESEASMGPGQPPMKCKGSMKSRMIGGFWVVSDMTGDMAGTTMTAVQTIGYDAEKKKYVGTWIDSMMNYMWKYEGTVDETGKILTLEAEGPNFMAAGKLTKFRDAYEIKSADHIVATSSMLTEDGKWIVFMTGNLTRRK